MKGEQALQLHALVTGRSTAALGTLHSGAPYVSMVPFAILDDASGFVIHVSLLAAHTRDMLADPRVSLLITGPETSNMSAQALPRLTVLGAARQIASTAPDYLKARQVYLERFPESAPIFTLGDFSLFLIEPDELRWVSGFAQARTLSTKAFAKAVREAQD